MGLGKINAPKSSKFTKLAKTSNNGEGKKEKKNWSLRVEKEKEKAHPKY